MTDSQKKFKKDILGHLKTFLIEAEEDLKKKGYIPTIEILIEDVDTQIKELENE